jgi:transcriptional regulator with XRE-family HTH domain
MLRCMKPLSVAERQALGGTIKEHREKRKYSQEELAAMAKCHQATVSRIESGLISRPDPVVLIDIARAVGANPLMMLAPYFETSDEDFAQVAS